jgi:ribose-phosphate pyrophosphokinase
MMGGRSQEREIMASPPIALFALNASRAFGERLAERLAIALEPHEERDFEDGEHKARPLVKVTGREVYVVQSLYADGVQSVDDKLCRLLFFLAALRDAAPAGVTAVVPYLAYARKDSRSQPNDPVTLRYVAALFEAAGADCVMALEPHNAAAFDNAFRCRAIRLEAGERLAAHLASAPGDDPLVVVSPDAGGIKRAERFRASLQARLGRGVTAAFLEKSRTGDTLAFGRLRGEVAGRRALIVDDLIATGATLAHAAGECRRQGALSVTALAAHGLFVGAADSLMRGGAIDRLVVTDTVPPFRLAPELVRARLDVVSVSGLFAEAIGGRLPGQAGRAG